MSDKKDEFYSLDEVLKELKLEKEELDKIISEGNLRAFKEEDHIKFRKEDIEKLRKEDFYSFENVLDELKLNEEELNRMVSEGELQAFKEKDAIHFKKDDIDNMKKGKITEPTVILPPDDLLKAENIGKEETFIEEDTSSITEELPFGDTDITIPSLDDDKIDLVGDDTGTVTTPLGEPEAYTGDTIADEDATIAEEFSETVAESPPVMKPAPSVQRAAPRPSRHLALPESIPAPVKVKVHPVFMVMLVFAFIILMFAGSFLGDIVRISTGEGNFPVGITRELGQIVVDIFGIKDDTGSNIQLLDYKP